MEGLNMKRSLAALVGILLIVEVATSWWVWTGQPSHGLVDVYGFSFIKYELERLLPWMVIVAIVLGLIVLLSNLRSPAKAKSSTFQ